MPGNVLCHPCKTCDFPSSRAENPVQFPTYSQRLLQAGAGRGEALLLLPLHAAHDAQVAPGRVAVVPQHLVIVLGTLPLGEVGHGVDQRVSPEGRQLLVVLGVLPAQRHLALEARLDRRLGLPPAAVAGNGDAQGALREDAITSTRMIDRAVRGTLHPPTPEYPTASHLPLVLPEVLRDVAQRVALVHREGGAELLLAVRAAEARSPAGVPQLLRAPPAQAVAARQLDGVVQDVLAHRAPQQLLHRLFVVRHPCPGVERLATRAHAGKVKAVVCALLAIYLRLEWEGPVHRTPGSGCNYGAGVSERVSE